MLAVEKLPLVLIGACEAAAQLLFMISAGHLPGVMLPVINQTYLIWNLLFATVLLRARQVIHDFTHYFNSHWQGFISFKLGTSSTVHLIILTHTRDVRTIYYLLFLQHLILQQLLFLQQYIICYSCNNCYLFCNTLFSPYLMRHYCTAPSGSHSSRSPAAYSSCWESFLRLCQRGSYRLSLEEDTLLLLLRGLRV